MSFRVDYPHRTVSSIDAQRIYIYCVFLQRFDPNHTISLAIFHASSNCWFAIQRQATVHFYFFVCGIACDNGINIINNHKYNRVAHFQSEYSYKVLYAMKTDKNVRKSIKSRGVMDLFFFIIIFGCIHISLSRSARILFFGCVYVENIYFIFISPFGHQARARKLGVYIIIYVIIRIQQSDSH